MPLQPVKPQLHELRRIRAVAAYQFGKGAEKAFPASILIVKLRVKVTPGVESFIKKGGNVFAKHVIGVDPELRPEEEVLVVDKKDRLLAVGRSFFNAIEMQSFKIGIAVKVRHGTADSE